MSKTTAVTLEDIQNFEGKYPKQLWGLFFSEMWERFCFYGMRGVLTYFMITHLILEVGGHMSESQANLQYGATQAFVYAFTFIGGLFADKILGFRKSLFWGGFLMIIGSAILAFDPFPESNFFLGISFTVIGTGFFKPNISTMVGSLYKRGDARRDAGFSLFYSGINIGALLGGYACIAIGKGQLFTSFIPEQYTWNVAFGLAGLVMTISLVTFIFTQKTLGPIGLSPFKSEDGNVKSVIETDSFGTVKPEAPGKVVVTVNSGKSWYEYAVYALTLALIPVIMAMVAKTEYTDYFMYTIGPLTLVYLGYEMTKHTWEESKKLIAALIFIVFSIVFWAFFEQSGGSLSIFAAKNLDNIVAGAVTLDPNGVNNAANSVFVIIFAPIVGLVWLAMAKKKIEPNTVIKFGLGFIFLAGGFYTFYTTRFFEVASGIASLDVFVVAYFIITFGELCLSPIGLSIMTKLSPQRLQGVMMGMWFLASAYGQYVAGILGAGLSTNGSEGDSLQQKLITYTDGYYQLAIYALIAGVVLIVISPLVRKLMQEVK
ncbi:peptide MFS transporter [Flavobacterium subsaxonicum]|uniref:Amino acid transporter n=1 Tax=Flavobacterium subsaxonicum WB 4.1-42 = DSM 21790 TaxID=1121898 RepID=A0A0A2N0Z2_9FLAO|nr:peptide MFS transporter [Flavobacterium subsaxonicum]KGO94120.1 amino acid transporter [Flavobacterium subsaxonicum WB 4.1-42 = DSM 21790]